MGKYEWVKVADRQGDHRVFRAKDGRLAIADRSGSLPDQTDDGVIWLVKDGKAEVHISEFSKRLMVRYDVQVDRYVAKGLDAWGSCCSGLHVLPSLRELDYDIAFAASLCDDMELMRDELLSHMHSGVRPQAPAKEVTIPVPVKVFLDSENRFAGFDEPSQGEVRTATEDAISQAKRFQARLDWIGEAFQKKS